MYKSYLKLAWRDLLKHKYFSLLNISGLTLGISLCMVIITIIQNQFSYDRFHPHPNRTFRIDTESLLQNGSTEDYATSPLPVAQSLKDNYSFVDDVATLSGGLSGNATVDAKNIFINGFFSGPSFSNVFGYELKFGDKGSALNSPNSIVLTHRTASKLYGETVNPVGQVLTIKGLGDFIVKGVFREPAGKTHLEFDAIGSSASMETLSKNNSLFSGLNDWMNYYSTYSYVLLRHASDNKQLSKALLDLSATHYQRQSKSEKGYKLYSQPISKIVPGPILSNNMGRALPEDVLWYLGIIGIVVIVAAGFNYNSLWLAKALKKSKEIGIRKSMGAKKYQLITQFLVESVLTAIIAMIMAALLFHYLLRPFFENIETFKLAGVVLYESPALYLIFLGFSIAVGLVSGIFPAFYLSLLNPLKALKDDSGGVFSPKLIFRKILLTLQFSIALVFIAGLVNIARQINYVTHADYGFRTENIIEVDLQGNNYETARQVLSGIPGVIAVSGSSGNMGTTKDRSVLVRFNSFDDPFRVMDFSVDEFHVDNFKLKLLSGKNFTPGSFAKKETDILVNEAFVHFFKLENPTAAIGKKVILGDSTLVTITGVLKDFNFQPLTRHILPVIFRYDPSDVSQLNIALSPASTDATLKKLGTAWDQVDHATGLKYSFLKDDLQTAYRQYASLPGMLGIISLISMVVAGLGLLGLAAFSLNQRTKEISIRKILGATVARICFLLSKSFLLLMALAFIIGLPVSTYLNNLFLSDFAYKINPLWGHMAATAFLFILVSLIIGLQIIRLAKTNPVNVLKAE